MKLTIHVMAGLPGYSDTTAKVKGDRLIIDGTAYDLGALQDGDEGQMEGDHPFVGAITRVDGQIDAAIRWFYDPAGACADQGKTHPVLVVQSGAVPDPVVRDGEVSA